MNSGPLVLDKSKVSRKTAAFSKEIMIRLPSSDLITMMSVESADNSSHKIPRLGLKSDTLDDTRNESRFEDIEEAVVSHLRFHEA